MTPRQQLLLARAIARDDMLAEKIIIVPIEKQELRKIMISIHL